MKIAILHDFFDKKGGGERLVLNLARALNADIYTGFIDYEKTFSTKGLKITSLNINQNLPVGIRNRMIASKFEEYDFHGYDALIISGIWCISASKNHPSILYCHTPARFLYDLRSYFLENSNFFQRLFLKKFIDYWHIRDQIYMNRFDKICPNSENVKKRILKFYGKKLYDRCEVVYTGIETKKFYSKASENFYLSTSRLDPLKRIDLIISVFKKLPDKKLFIIGTGPEEASLKKLSNGYENILFLGNVGEKKLLDMYARCKAVIVAAKDEDLGLSAIEAQAAGKPVVAVREGGLLETVNTNTGIFFEPNAASLKKAIEAVEKRKWNTKAIQKNAGRYDIKVFIKNMKRIINQTVKTAKKDNINGQH